MGKSTNLTRSQKAAIYRVILACAFSAPLSRETRKGKDFSDLYWHKRSEGGTAPAGECCFLLLASPTSELLLLGGGCLKLLSC